MMTDRALASAIDAITEVERHAREHLSATADEAERDAALIAVRQATALRKPLEKWLAGRAVRAQRLA